MATALLISLIEMPVGSGQTTAGQTTSAGQAAKSQAEQIAAQAKSQADKLPDLPANLAAKLKPVGNSRVFVVAAPRSTATVRQPMKPPVRQPSGGTAFALSCMHDTKFWVTAEYPVLLCHPAIDDIVATNSGSISARTAPGPTSSPAPATKQTPPSKQAPAATSKQARPATRLEPEAALSYRVRSSARGLLVCSYARMPVLATLEKRGLNCQNPNAFAYSIDIAGVGLNWTGDPEMRPADLHFFDEPSCKSDTPTSCSGASTCTPLCGAGGGPSPTPVPPPALR